MNSPKTPQDARPSNVRDLGLCQRSGSYLDVVPSNAETLLSLAEEQRTRFWMVASNIKNCDAMCKNPHEMFSTPNYSREPRYSLVNVLGSLAPYVLHAVRSSFITSAQRHFHDPTCLRFRICF